MDNRLKILYWSVLYERRSDAAEPQSGPQEKPVQAEERRIVKYVREIEAVRGRENFTSTEVAGACCQEKLLSRYDPPVPQTDTGR